MNVSLRECSRRRIRNKEKLHKVHRKKGGYLFFFLTHRGVWGVEKVISRVIKKKKKPINCFPRYSEYFN